MYQEILISHAFTVRGGGSGEEGLEIIKTLKPDLIMLDLMLPGMDGLEVLRIIRKSKEIYGSPIIIVLTNLSNEVMIKDAFYEKADGYLMKTELTPEQVISEIRGFLNISE